MYTFASVCVYVTMYVCALVRMRVCVRMRAWLYVGACNLCAHMFVCVAVCQLFVCQ